MIQLQKGSDSEERSVFKKIIFTRKCVSLHSESNEIYFNFLFFINVLVSSYVSYFICTFLYKKLAKIHENTLHIDRQLTSSYQINSIIRKN